MAIFDFDGANAVSVRPASRSTTVGDTWARDETTPGAGDGTRLTATFVNSLKANLRQLLMEAGIPAPAASDDGAVTRAVRALIGTPINIFAAAPGETGVINAQYPVGDVRRYGVFPDQKYQGTDAAAPFYSVAKAGQWVNWEGDFGGRMVAIYANGTLPGIEIYWPGGYYATGINLDWQNSGLKMYSAGAEFGAVIHLINTTGVETTPLTNVTLRGTWVTYDRFGAIRLQKSYIQRVICKSDPTKNTAGNKGRGAHIFTTILDVRIDDLVIEACGTGAAINTDAAFAMDTSDCSRVSIGRLQINDCEGHGAFILGSNHTIERLVINGFGSGAHDRGIAETLGLAQSQELCGLWMRRCSGTRILDAQISQVAGSRPNARYHLRVDETNNSTVAGPWVRPRIDRLVCTNLQGRGCSIGDRNNNSTYLSELDIGSFEWSAMAGTTFAAGYSALHVNANAAPSTSGLNKLVVDHLLAHDVNGNNTLQVPANTWAHIGSGDTSRGVNGTVVSWQGQGYLGPWKHRHTGGSGTTTPFILTPVATSGAAGGLKHDVISIDDGGAIPSIIAVDYLNAVDVEGGPVHVNGYRGAPVIRMQLSTRCNIKLGKVYGTATPAGWGLRLFGNVDCTISGGTIGGFAIGTTANGAGGAATLTRCAALNVVSTGNTVNTDIPAGSGLVAIANCLNVTL